MNALLLVFVLVVCSIDCNAVVLKVNLICPANGKGLELDGKILDKALTSLGCSVCWFQGTDEASIPPADINLFCEQLHPHLYPSARLNWFIPNPECYCQDMSFLDGIDLILCRTREVVRIFEGLGKSTFSLGFTTPDAYAPGVRKNFYSCIHVAGSSPHKGTKPIVDAWRRNRYFPVLTVVSLLGPPPSTPRNIRWKTPFLRREELRLRQNQCGIHLCLSETEGFGHYLIEAMSCSSVVITTDAPPMNEFIRDPRFLVPYSYATQQFLGIKYHVTSEAVEEKITQVLNLPVEELMAAGASNRAAYLEMDSLFYENLGHLIADTSVAITNAK